MLTKDNKGTVSFDARRCVICGTCVSVCPTKALLCNYQPAKAKHILFDRKKCVSCGLCLQVCPVAHFGDVVTKEHFVNSKVQAYIAWSKDKEMQFVGSSGGVARTIIVEALKNKIVDAVYTLYDTGKTNDLEGHWLSTECHHSKIPTSIYRPVFWGKNLNKLSLNWKHVLVVGLPCHILASSLYLKNIAPEMTVYAVSIFCKKQKTEDMTLCYLKEFCYPPSDVRDFRYRGNGYPGCFRVLNKVKTAPYIYPPTVWNLPGCQFCLDPFVGGVVDFTVADPRGFDVQDKANAGANLFLVHNINTMTFLRILSVIHLRHLDNLEHVFEKSLLLGAYSEKKMHFQNLIKGRKRVQRFGKQLISKCGEFFYRLVGINSKLSSVIRKLRRGY